MNLDGRTIAEATRGELLRDGPEGPVVTDTRKIVAGAWFVALVGERFDAHGFLEQAAAAGCAGVVASRVPEGWTRGFVRVPDTLVALQDLGRAVRRSFGGPVVGITGSAGKTSTRVMVADVLRALGQVHHTEGNLNNHVGVPLTLLAAPPHADIMVLEMGMNHRGEIALLQDIGRPTVRVVTNVGAAHVEGCGSLEGVALAKQEMFDGARPGDVCVVNVDDPRIAAMPLPPGARVLTCGARADADVRLVDVAIDPEALSTRLSILTPTGSIRATLATPGAHLAANAVVAAAVGCALGVSLDAMGAALSRFQPEGMRNRLVRIGGALVLDDAYNANPLSMDAALRTLAALPGRRVAALGDMLELGPAEEECHRDVLARALSLPMDAVFVTGERMARAAASFSDDRLRVFPDVGALGEALHPWFAEDVASAVLLKGSRGARMERAIDGVRPPHLPGGGHG
jgi:UDP-N-acetylmuramoyl-tripeptide--D-alanyl-D-alanine ligase